MEFWRRAKGCIHRIRNDSIRREFNIFSTNQRNTENKIKWKEHVDIMQDDRISKKVLDYKCRHTKSFGKLRKWCCNLHKPNTWYEEEETSKYKD